MWQGATKFTFHYASTLSSSKIKKQGALEIYIPLCFYFILYPVADDAPQSHLHSTMLLLYPKYFLSNNLYNNNLHSTMLLLYRSIWHIPNCDVLNLHSTMLLLYRWRLLVVVSPRPIYIPLCFYFICNHGYRPHRYFVIYIPLCFYFINAWPWDWGASDNIYIPLCFYFIGI